MSPPIDKERFGRLTAEVMNDPEAFSRDVLGVPLRRYQLEVAEAVLKSVLERRGLTFAVMMSRQAGKNEVAAHLAAQLLMLHQRQGGSLVKASPTFRPQTINSILRLQARLDNPLTKDRWSLERGYILRLGRARMFFFSAQPEASVVGATASILLEGDEAQDIPEDKWNRDFRPMGAATNVTTVLWGTAWTSRTLLARTIEALRRQQAEDGIRRVFIVPWRTVAEEVPAYGDYVRGEIARLGADHPSIRSQYELQTIDAQAGMFPPERRERMQGLHMPHSAPQPGVLYALCIDVAGQAAEGETSPVDPHSRDCTACTLFLVEQPPLGDPLAGRPCYRVVRRWWWRGLAQADLYARLVDIIDTWGPRRIVVDATGLGAGLASFLQLRFGRRVLPFTFTAATKSDLGWRFLALCDTARFKDHTPDGSPAQAEFWRQVAAAEYEACPGESGRLRWGVHPSEGHDDLLISAALCAALDGQPWAGGESLILTPTDPLDEIDRSRF